MDGTPRGPVISLPEHGIEIPPGILDLESFRAWARSEGFPEKGRIDWVAGRLEVDLSPMDLNTHGGLQSAIAGHIARQILETERGFVYIGRSRLSNPRADISVEPDVLVLLTETLQTGRARPVPRIPGENKCFMELEGTADLVVECVCDTSEAKDRVLLPEGYHRAGVGEYWIADVRKRDVELLVLHHHEDGYLPASLDEGGFQASRVLRQRVKLVEARRTAGLVFYSLEVRE